MDVGVGIQSRWETDTTYVQAVFTKALGELFCCGVSGGVAVVGDQYPADAVFFAGGEMIVGKALDAVAGSDVAVALHPEGHGVDEGFAEDEVCTGRKSAEVPDATMWSRQVEVISGARTEVV